MRDAEENLEVVRTWFSGLARGDVSPELCDPEIEIVNWAESPATGPYHGHDGLHRWWSDIGDAIDDVHFELQEITALDDGRVLTIQRIVGRFHLTGIDVDAPWGSVISVRDGKISRAVGYATPSQARRAAGVLG